MLSMLSFVFAQTTQAGTGAAGGQQQGLGEMAWSFLPFVAIAVVMYLILFRPMQKEKKQREALLNQIKKNDDVILTSGIYGSVIGVAEDKDEITVKIADNA